jgi:hypothetical protein
MAYIPMTNKIDVAAGGGEEEREVGLLRITKALKLNAYNDAR